MQNEIVIESLSRTTSNFSWLIWDNKNNFKNNHYFCQEPKQYEKIHRFRRRQQGRTPQDYSIFQYLKTGSNHWFLIWNSKTQGKLSYLPDTEVA